VHRIHISSCLIRYLVCSSIHFKRRSEFLADWQVSSFANGKQSRRIIPLDAEKILNVLSDRLATW